MSERRWSDCGSGPSCVDNRSASCVPPAKSDLSADILLVMRAYAYMTVFCDLGIPPDLVRSGPHFRESDPSQVGFGLTVLPGPDNPDAKALTFMLYEGDRDRVTILGALWNQWLDNIDNIDVEEQMKIRATFFPVEDLPGRPGWYRSHALDLLVTHLHENGHYYPRVSEDTDTAVPAPDPRLN